MSIYEIEIRKLDGTPLSLSEFTGRPMLVVNVASFCGLTPHYEGLQNLHEQYADEGLVVLGVPCNQFGQQEPGTAEEIRQFCQSKYGVQFELTEKIDVNGPTRHPLYEKLAQATDTEGNAGDVQWNFEKFVVGSDGEVVARFRPQTTPDDPALVGVIQSQIEAAKADHPSSSSVTQKQPETVRE